MLIIMSASRKKASIIDELKDTDKSVARELVDLGFSEHAAKMAVEFELYYPTGQKNDEGQTIFQKSRISEDASDLKFIQELEIKEGQLLPSTIAVGVPNPDYEFNQLGPKRQRFNMEAEKRLQEWKDRLKP